MKAHTYSMIIYIRIKSIHTYIIQLIKNLLTSYPACTCMTSLGFHTDTHTYMHTHTHACIHSHKYIL